MTLAAVLIAVGALTPNQSGWRIFVCLQTSGRTFDAINPAHDNDGGIAPPGERWSVEKRKGAMSGIDVVATREPAIELIHRSGG